MCSGALVAWFLASRLGHDWAIVLIGLVSDVESGDMIDNALARDGIRTILIVGTLMATPCLSAGSQEQEFGPAGTPGIASMATGALRFAQSERLPGGIAQLPSAPSSTPPAPPAARPSAPVATPQASSPAIAAVPDAKPGQPEKPSSKTSSKGKSSKKSTSTARAKRSPSPPDLPAGGP
jgi:hypothetical protein